MLEISLARTDLRRYLLATRGPGSEYLPYPTDRMARFFGDFLETHDALGADLSGVRLVFVNSHRGDIEHLHVEQGSCIVFDQSLLELLGLVSDSALHSLSLGTPNRGPFPSILSALYAARNLALGDLFDAAFDASVCRTLRRNDPAPYAADERRRNAWVELQGCFTIGHEVMHTKLNRYDDAILASLIAADYKKRMLPHVRHLDERAGLQGGDWADQWRLVPGTEDSWVPQVLRKDLSWEAKLTWVLETPDGFGQEILCDYGAALAVSRNLGKNILSPDECLLACYVALVARACMTAVESRIRAYTSSVPAITDTLRIATELRTRIDFLRLALAPIARNGAYKDIRSNEGQAEDDRVTKLVTEQWDRFEETLRRLDETWTRPLIKLASGGKRLGNIDNVPPWPDDLDVADLFQASDYVRESVGVRLEL